MAEEATTEAAEAPAEEAPEQEQVELGGDAQKVIELVKEMPALELSRLVKALEELWGVSAAAPMAVAAGPGAGGAAEAEEEEEQTAFDVHLTEIGDKKIQVIKAVRQVVSGLGLKEAKALVDGTPTAVKEGVSKEEADKIAAALQEAGASVEIK
ncbi:MAG: 50S ribosomal protein L7/L12 [Planctomycetota bacterium]